MFFFKRINLYRYAEAQYDYTRVSTTYKSAQDLGYEGIWPTVGLYKLNAVDP